MSNKELLGWIEERLKDLKSELDMDAEKYREKIQSEHIHMAFNTHDTYAYRVGMAIGEINFILKEIKERSDEDE